MKRRCVDIDGRCSQCGRTLAPRMARECPAWGVGHPVVAVARESEPRILLGDRIESALTSIGITKERWASFTSAFGEPPTAPGCGGCEKRQKAINDADLWMRNAAAELGSAAADAISKVWAPVSWLRRKNASNQSGNPPSEPAKMKD